MRAALVAATQRRRVSHANDTIVARVYEAVDAFRINGTITLKWRVYLDFIL